MPNSSCIIFINTENKISQQQESNIVESVTEDTKVTEEQTAPVSASKQVKDETNLLQENLLSSAIAEEVPKVAKKEENKQEKKSPETTEVKLESEVDIEQIDMSGIFKQQFLKPLFSTSF